MRPGRILLLVPHPDDEIVGCGAAISRARGAGAQVFAIYLTTGLPPREHQWPWQRTHYDERIERRRAEARRVAERLGITPLTFQDWPSRTLKDHLPQAHRLVRHALDTHAINAVWAPAYEGGHQDHDVTNLLASTLGDHVQILEFAEYNFQDRVVRTNQFARQAGNGGRDEDVVLALTPRERGRKAEMLSLYASERANLSYVQVRSERFRPLAHYDYSRPPHAPPLFYQRFQWVPFPHPRVDFTRPTEVCAAMTAFLSGV